MGKPVSSRLQAHSYIVQARWFLNRMERLCFAFHPLPSVLLGVFVVGRVGHEQSKKDKVQVCLNFVQNVPKHVPGVASFIKLPMDTCILSSNPFSYKRSCFADESVSWLIILKECLHDPMGHSDAVTLCLCGVCTCLWARVHSTMQM